MTVAELVDRGGKLDVEIKERDKEKKSIVAKLKAIATKTGKGELVGNIYVAAIGDVEMWDISYEELSAYLKKRSMISKLKEYVSVKKEPIKHDLGEIIKEQIGTVTLKRFSRCEFKQNEGKASNGSIINNREVRGA